MDNFRLSCANVIRGHQLAVLCAGSSLKRRQFSLSFLSPSLSLSAFYA